MKVENYYSIMKNKRLYLLLSLLFGVANFQFSTLNFQFGSLWAQKEARITLDLKGVQAEDSVTMSWGTFNKPTSPRILQVNANEKDHPHPPQRAATHHRGTEGLQWRLRTVGKPRRGNHPLRTHPQGQERKAPDGGIPEDDHHGSRLAGALPECRG